MSQISKSPSIYYHRLILSNLPKSLSLTFIFFNLKKNIDKSINFM